MPSAMPSPTIKHFFSLPPYNANFEKYYPTLFLHQFEIADVTLVLKKEDPSVKNNY